MSPMTNAAVVLTWCNRSGRKAAVSRTTATACNPATPLAMVVAPNRMMRVTR